MLAQHVRCAGIAEKQPVMDGSLVGCVLNICLQGELVGKTSLSATLPLWIDTEFPQLNHSLEDQCEVVRKLFHAWGCLITTQAVRDETFKSSFVDAALHCRCEQL